MGFSRPPGEVWIASEYGREHFRNLGVYVYQADAQKRCSQVAARGRDLVFRKDERFKKVERWASEGYDVSYEVVKFTVVHGVVDAAT